MAQAESGRSSDSGLPPPPPSRPRVPVASGVVAGEHLPSQRRDRPGLAPGSLTALLVGRRAYHRTVSADRRLRATIAGSAWLRRRLGGRHLRALVRPEPRHRARHLGPRAAQARAHERVRDPRSSCSCGPLGRPWLAIALGALYAVSDEVHQYVRTRASRCLVRRARRHGGRHARGARLAAGSQRRGVTGGAPLRARRRPDRPGRRTRRHPPAVGRLAGRTRRRSWASTPRSFRPTAPQPQPRSTLRGRQLALAARALRGGQGSRLPAPARGGERGPPPPDAHPGTGSARSPTRRRSSPPSRSPSSARHAGSRRSRAGRRAREAPSRLGADAPWRHAGGADPEHLVNCRHGAREVRRRQSTRARARSTGSRAARADRRVEAGEAERR